METRTARSVNSQLAPPGKFASAPQEVVHWDGTISEDFEPIGLDWYAAEDQRVLFLVEAGFEALAGPCGHECGGKREAAFGIQCDDHGGTVRPRGKSVKAGRPTR